ncbi:MAG: hypothetical protein ACRDIU_08435 [Actinomycetota bacterium]
MRQRGSAMVIVLLVMAVLTGFAAVIFNVGTANLANSGRDRLGGGALGAAEAGVAHALAYMRTYGLSQLTCDGPNTGSLLCGKPWGYNYPSAGAGGQTTALPAGRSYRVWVQRVQPFAPPASANEGKYRVFSSGFGGAAGGRRVISVEVTARPFSYPQGIFGRDYVRDAGNSTIRKESLFSLGCIGKRERLNFDTSSVDLAHPELVPGAHSAKWISTSNVTSLADPDCAPTEIKNIHRSPPAGAGPCNPAFPYDQDLQGGPLTGTLCAPSALPGSRGLPTPPGSFFDEAALRSYGYGDPRGLPANQYGFLRAVAADQGNFYDCTASPPSPGCNAGAELSAITQLNGSLVPNAVLYVKLAPGKKLTLGPTNITGFEESFCGSRSLLLVVEGGDLTMNSNLDIVGAVFVPDGTGTMTGGMRLLGTIFARELFLTGNNEIYLKSPCFFDNPPAGSLSIIPGQYQELDR